MSVRSEARMRFIKRVQLALDVAQDRIRGLMNDLTVQAEIVHSRQVPDIIGKWRSVAKLNWDAARRKCGSTTKSCFVGIRTAEIVCILSLIRVSKAGLHTKLLFIERDEHQDQSKGKGFLAIEAVLEAVAAVFGSAYIVLDAPLKETIEYYSSHGFRVARIRGRSARTMTRPVRS